MTIIQNQDWIDEAAHAINKVVPGACVVSANRGFELFGKKAPIHARVTDGSEWVVEDGKARKLSDDEIASYIESAKNFE